jgi:membrane protein
MNNTDEMKTNYKTLSWPRTFWELLKETAEEFGDDHATKLSASLAYFTIFSIGPLLLVIVHILGLFYQKRDDAASQVLDQVRIFIGPKAASQLESLLTNMDNSNSSTLFGIIGILVFVFSATSIFTEMQSSINYMWSVKARPKRGWLKFITDRLLSLLLIGGIGLMLILSLTLNVVVDMVAGQLQQFEYLHQYLGSDNISLLTHLNSVVLYVVVTFLFAIIFKVLPDAIISWRDALVGAGFTGFLFLIGKFLISLYLTNSKLISAYGAAASLIILLSWIYYSALILYFGAEFTDVYARKCGKGVVVKKTAVFVIKREAKELPNLTTHVSEDLG